MVRYYLSQFHVGSSGGHGFGTRRVCVPAEIVKHDAKKSLRSPEIPEPRTEGQGSAELVLPDSAVQHGPWNQRSFDLAPA